MTDFAYKAINDKGAVISGIIEADSAGAAENKISSRGYTPWKIKKAKDRHPSSVLSKIQGKIGVVKISELVLFTKQLRSMLRAGIPMIRLLGVIEHQTQNRTLKNIANDFNRQVKQGLSLFECMERYPTVFSPLYCNIVKAGEISGSVPEVLKRLIYIIEHEQKIKAKIKDALRYPIIVIGALGISFFVLLTYVIPKFAVLFEKAGVELPLPTRLAIQLYTFMSDYWQILIVGMGALIVGLVVSLRTEEGKYVRDSIYLKLPLVGAIFVKAAMSRFASIFAILHASGVSVVNSMNILSGTIGNVVISKAFDNMSERLKEGQGITEPLKSSAVFPPMVIDMIAIGEETGNLEDMLQEISNHYDDEVEFSVNSISEYLGPILIAGLAGNVGFFAMAIFLPMWEMINLVK